jgi:hypothetical protein
MLLRNLAMPVREELRRDLRTGNPTTTHMRDLLSLNAILVLLLEHST